MGVLGCKYIRCISIFNVSTPHTAVHHIKEKGCMEKILRATSMYEVVRGNIVVHFACTLQRVFSTGSPQLFNHLLCNG